MTSIAAQPWTLCHLKPFVLDPDNDTASISISFPFTPHDSAQMSPPGLPELPSLIRCPCNLTLNLRTYSFPLYLNSYSFFKILHWSTVDFQCFVRFRYKNSHSLLGYVYLRLGICEGKYLCALVFSSEPTSSFAAEMNPIPLPRTV